MKKLTAVLIAVVGLSSCVAYAVDEDRRYGYPERDRDRDGVAHRRIRIPSRVA